MASTTTFPPLPPCKTHTSTRLPLPHAHALLSHYLRSAAKTPHLQPNALLTEDGPVHAAGGGVGLVMHNLERVCAGLAGEFLGAEVDGLGDVDRVEGEDGKEEPSKGLVPEVEVEMKDEWQDRGEFEREEEVLVGGEMGGHGRSGKEEKKREKMERRMREKKAKREKAEKGGAMEEGQEEKEGKVKEEKEEEREKREKKERKERRRKEKEERRREKGV